MFFCIPVVIAKTGANMKRTRCSSLLSGGQISEEVGGFAGLQLAKRAAVNQKFLNWDRVSRGGWESVQEMRESEQSCQAAEPGVVSKSLPTPTCLAGSMRNI